MKNNEATIFVFIASIIIGILISMNIGFKGKINFLDIKQYDQAYNERTKLYSELNNLKEQYHSTSVKLKKYDTGDEKTLQVSKEIKKEVINNNLIIGNSDVQGQGVIIKLEDGADSFDKNVTMNQLIHDSDIVQVINDLRNAGAEAISVNGIRVVYDNWGVCYGASIKLNGVNIVTPFYISAIGNKDIMYNYLTLEQTHTLLLQKSDVKINIAKSDNIKILAYNGDFIYKYMSLVNK
ncbi:DUF881 domain-containing protein [Clostridium estertheticum]|uniref:DUF881 domain-containing protein n=1 Tax=Clostridium estertheticum TaxID=238834 RepID=A0A5N7J384_9CLOT|nr:DUF881 domain-containing protein [Clostridium estertheticum]MCB2340818.1 DUF881 domain-containing protein [Clostridium estertheticum]MPQ32493.1 DUF881 domain-containing protein [Clostridium estertheticum]MPQ63152.1 DUF881 domain-containing protein [Clostridium estertheticum]